MQDKNTKGQVDWGPEPASRTLLNKVVALLPEREVNAIWTKWRTVGISRADAEAQLAELEAARKTKLPTQPVEVAVQVFRQTAQRTREAVDAELARAEAERRRQVFQMTHYAWLEQQYAQREQEGVWRRRYDPTGNWGPMTLASGEE